MPWQPLPGSGDDPPVPVGRALDRLLGDLRAPRARTVQSVFDRWSEVVGGGLAAHATPVSLREGRLVLSVEDPAWATQIRFLESELLERLRDELGADEVRAIEVRVRGSSARRPPRGRA